jgi:hypothetical protein
MTPQEEFWKWFLLHEAKLFSFDPSDVEERERIFDELAIELGKINPRLGFEFGPNEVVREFVVSAFGVKSAFGDVMSLVNIAPSLTRWRIIAFRPRRNPINTVEFGGKHIHPEEVQFILLNNGRNAGINLFIPGFHEDDADLKMVGYLLLDEALGEFDVETRLGLIKMLPPETQTEGKRYPLPQLPDLFDKLVSRLEGISSRPS